MTERIGHTSSIRERARRTIATSALSLSLFSLLSGCDSEASDIFPLAPIEQLPDQKAPLPLQTLYEYKQAHDGSVDATFDMLPAAHSNALKRAIDDPVVQLAIKEGDVDFIGASENTGRFSALTGTLISAYDNGKFEVINPKSADPVKQILLEFGIGTVQQDLRVYTDSYMVRLALVHEAVHALNNDWWMALVQDQSVDEELAAKINEVRKRCTPVGRSLYEKAIRSYDITGDTDFVDEMAKSCGSSLPFIDQDIGEEAFKCIDEGQMIKTMRHYNYNPPGGHPYDNATELASSVATVLYLDPVYIKRCFEAEGEAAHDLKAYVRSVLEVSFYHRPELETILRNNELTSQTIDYLLAS